MTGQGVFKIRRNQLSTTNTIEIALCSRELYWGHRQSCCICCSCLCCCSVPRTFQVLVQPFKSVSVDHLLLLSHIKGISASDMCSWSAERHGTSLIECVCVWPAIQISIYLSIYLSTYLPIYLSTYLPIYLSTYLSTYLPSYLAT